MVWVFEILVVIKYFIFVGFGGGLEFCWERKVVYVCGFKVLVVIKFCMFVCVCVEVFGDLGFGSVWGCGVLVLFGVVVLLLMLFFGGFILCV